MNNNIAYGHGHKFTDCGMQTGYVTVKPTANEVTTFDVEFGEPFAEVPDIVIVSPVTAVPYTTVRYVSASSYTATGFKLHIYRTTATSTDITWLAVGKAASKKEG